MATGERSNPGSDDGRRPGAEPSAALEAPGAVGGAIPTAGIGERPLDPDEPGDVTGSLASAVDEIEFDSIEEVDATARSIRRAAIEYGAFFFVILLLVPVLSVLAPWWSRRAVWAGLPLGFIVVAVGLHLLFIALVFVGARAADRIEDDMLGRPEDDYRHLQAGATEELRELEADV